ncbi:MAG: NrdJb [Gammaproteobacteria bacterium]
MPMKIEQKIVKYSVMKEGDKTGASDAQAEDSEDTSNVIHMHEKIEFQWIVALTRIISAVFRKGGDVTFLVEELKAVFDPRGGYFKKGGKYMPSLVAEIGDAIEHHLRTIGLLKNDGPDEHQQKLIAEKRSQFDQSQKKSSPPDETAGFPDSAQLCGKCHTKAVIVMDGCLTCLNCGDSKCG